MIAARDLTIHAGTRTLLAKSSFTIEAGTFLAVLGPNGAGKTTLLQTIAGARAPAGGCVEIEGIDVRRIRPAARARLLARVVTDDVFSERLRVREVVALGRYPYRAWWQWSEDSSGESMVDVALAAVAMEPFQSRLFDTLSSGERARVWIAMALAQEAPVLLLDEPTSHLDARAAQDILSLLRERRERGATIVCVLHDLNEAAAYADSVLLLAGGMALSGSVESLHSSGHLQRAYGVEFEAFALPGGYRIFPRVTSRRRFP